MYLGGLPVTGSLVSGLYPTLIQVNTFSGCIRNVQSNGYYIDMNSPLISANSSAGSCPCSFTKSCISPIINRAANFVQYRLMWMIIAPILMNILNY